MLPVLTTPYEVSIVTVPSFTSEETEAERVSGLSKVTQLVSGRVRIHARASVGLATPLYCLPKAERPPRKNAKKTVRQSEGQGYKHQGRLPRPEEGGSRGPEAEPALSSG